MIIVGQQRQLSTYGVGLDFTHDRSYPNLDCDRGRVEIQSLSK